MSKDKTKAKESKAAVFFKGVKAEFRKIIWPDRDTLLKQMLDEKGVKELVVIGAMSHMCIEATSRAAADFGYSVTVVHDACATMNLEFEGTLVPAAQVHAAAMAALAFGYASIKTTDAYLA